MGDLVGIAGAPERDIRHQRGATAVAAIIGKEKQRGKDAVGEHEAIGKGNKKQRGDAKHAAVCDAYGGQDVEPALAAGEIEQLVDG